MKNRWTKPPWVVGEDVSVYSEGDGKEIILPISGCVNQDKSNAQLIAAAPELYEALYRLVEQIPEGVNFYDEEKAAMLALDKAEGRIK